MSTPTERVADYLRWHEAQPAPSHRVATIESQSGDRETHLTVADIHALLAAAQQPTILGHVVAGRDGILHHNLPRPQHEAELIRDQWTRDLPEGLDWDYRVVAITELPTQEAASA